MQDDLDISIGFDNRLESYSSFYDHDWAGEFLDSTEGLLLKPAGLVLCRDWKGVALASRMSWLMVHAIDSFQKSLFQHRTSDPQRMMNAIVEHVTKDAGIRHLTVSAGSSWRWAYSSDSSASPPRFIGGLVGSSSC